MPLLPARDAAVKAAVIVHIGQHVTNRVSRRVALARRLELFEDTGLQPVANQLQHPSVAYPMLKEVQQPLMIDRVTQVIDVHLHDPAWIGLTSLQRNAIERFGSAARALKSAGELHELRLINGV